MEAKKTAVEVTKTAAEAKQSAMEAEIANLKQQLARRKRSPEPVPVSARSISRRISRVVPFEYVSETIPPIKQEVDGQVRKRGRGTFTSTAHAPVPSFLNADL
jgi:hypothetical protein